MCGRSDSVDLRAGAGRSGECRHVAGTVNATDQIVLCVRDVNHAVGCDDYVRRMMKTRLVAASIGESRLARGSGDRCDDSSRRDAPDGVVLAVGNNDVPALVDVHSVRLVESRGASGSVFRAFAPVAGQSHDVSMRRDSPDDMVIAVGQEDDAIRIDGRRIRTVKADTASSAITKTHLTGQTGQRRDIALRCDFSDDVISIVRYVNVSLTIDAESGRFVETRRRSAAVAVADAARSACEVDKGVPFGGRGSECESQRDDGGRNNTRRGLHWGRYCYHVQSRSATLWCDFSLTGDRKSA